MRRTAHRASASNRASSSIELSTGTVEVTMTQALLRRTVGVAALSIGLAGCNQGTDAQGGGKPVPYKVGTFDQSGRAFVAIVLKETQVGDIGPANAAWESGNASAPKLAMP